MNSLLKPHTFTRYLYVYIWDNTYLCIYLLFIYIRKKLLSKILKMPFSLNIFSTFWATKDISRIKIICLSCYKKTPKYQRDMKSWHLWRSTFFDLTSKRLTGLKILVKRKTVFVTSDTHRWYLLWYSLRTPDLPLRRRGWKHSSSILMCPSPIPTSLLN